MVLTPIRAATISLNHLEISLNSYFLGTPCTAARYVTVGLAKLGGEPKYSWLDGYSQVVAVQTVAVLAFTNTSV